MFQINPHFHQHLYVGCYEDGGVSKQNETNGVLFNTNKQTKPPFFYEKQSLKSWWWRCRRDSDGFAIKSLLCRGLASNSIEHGAMFIYALASYHFGKLAKQLWHPKDACLENIIVSLLNIQ